ncbi:hypothetical protein Q8F55_005389 [Vanrija albida]|uniref:Major facilitator superfamily (MFS) profile domain-containing protein n=1 Tax=Vanrija albida TaxID=181172 RepID=A0ABR3Q1Q1_9TREE
MRNRSAQDVELGTRSDVSQPAVQPLPTGPAATTDEKHTAIKVPDEENDLGATTDETSVATDEIELPNGGYGWVVVICVLGVNACTWGVNTTYGVYSSYFLQHNYYAATQLDYAWVGGLSAAIAVAMGPLANLFVRKFGFKAPMYAGSVLVGLGQCCAGVTKSFGGFLACQGIVFGIGLGMLLVPSQPLVAHWFDKRLAFAQGIAQAGSGVGGVIWANTTPLLLQRVGVKWTLVTNGLITMVILLIATFFIKGRHTAVGAKSASFHVSLVWTNFGFAWFLVWGALTIMAYFIAIYTLASYCTDGLGLTQKQGGAVMSILAAGQIVGRPVWGYALDRGGRVNMVIVSYLICAVATLAIWLPGRSFGLMALFGLLHGLTGGTIHSAATPMLTSIVGLQDLGSALAIYWVDLSIPSLVSQVLAILLVNYSRNHLGKTGADAYTISIGFCGAVTFAGAFALIGSKRYLQGDFKILKKS